MPPKWQNLEGGGESKRDLRCIRLSNIQEVVEQAKIPFPSLKPFAFYSTVACALLKTPTWTLLHCLREDGSLPDSSTATAQSGATPVWAAVLLTCGGAPAKGFEHHRRGHPADVEVQDHEGLERQ